MVVSSYLLLGVSLIVLYRVSDRTIYSVHLSAGPLFQILAM
nr:MAG TPA: hypothetical protein [Caudoviricetes sp.]